MAHSRITKIINVFLLDFFIIYTIIRIIRFRIKFQNTYIYYVNYSLSVPNSKHTFLCFSVNYRKKKLIQIQEKKNEN